MTGALIAGAVGLAATVGSTMYTANKQEKAAASAAAEAAKAADKAAAVSTSENTAQQTNTQQKAQSTVDSSALRRSSLSKTVNRVSLSGLRTTLG